MAHKIKILSYDVIKCLNNRYGPILNPITVSDELYARIKKEGHHVIDVDVAATAIARARVATNYVAPKAVAITPKTTMVPKEKPETTQVNPYGEIAAPTAIETFASTDTPVEPTPAAEASNEARLSKAQRKALARARRAEEAAAQNNNVDEVVEDETEAIASEDSNN